MFPGRGVPFELNRFLSMSESRSIARVAPWSREDTLLDLRVRRRLFTADRSMIVVCRLVRSGFPPAHVHPVEQITTVVSGRLEVRIAGRSCLLGPARSLVVPAGIPHACRAVGPQDAEVFHVYAPETPRLPNRPAR